MRVFFLILLIALILLWFCMCCEYGKKIGKFIIECFKHFTRGEIKECQKHSRRQSEKSE